MKKVVGLVLFVGVFASAIYFAKNSGSQKQEMDFASRAPDAVAGQQAMVDEITSVILSVQDKTQINPAVKKIGEIAARAEAKMFPGVQIMAAVASLVPKFEGIIWRCREIIEPSDWLHMSALFKLRGIAYNDFVYGKHVRALFDYVVDPSDTQGEPFKKVSELQDYLADKVAPGLASILAQANQMEKLPDANFVFQFNRTVLTGVRDGIRFIDPEETSKTFIKPYHYTMTFLLQRALMSIYYFSALDLDEAPLVANRVLKATTMNTFKGDLRLGDSAMGVTPQLVYEQIKKTNSFLGFRPQIGEAKANPQEILDKAFELGKKSAQYQLLAYVCGIKYHMGAPLKYPEDCGSFPGGWSPQGFVVANGSKFLFDPNGMVLGFKSKYHAFRDRVRVYTENAKNIAGYVTVTSDVTGKAIRVRPHAFFEANHPQRDFMPIAYELPNDASETVNVGGKPSKKWHYDHGRPAAYGDFTFGGFFDRAEVKDMVSLDAAMTTLMYTDAIAPFAVFIRLPSPVRFIIPLQEIMSSN